MVRLGFMILSDLYSESALGVITDEEHRAG
jgi:hypothetical protein